MPGPFTYYDTPQASEKINATQPLIRTNFTSISDEFLVNHVGLTVSADAGKHNIITMPVTTAATTTTANYANLYFKIPAQGAALETVTLLTKEICLKKSADQGIPITAFAASPDGYNATTGWAYLPSGIIMKWGLGTLGGSTTVTFPTGASIPAFTKIFNIQLTRTVGVATGYLRLEDVTISPPTNLSFNYVTNLLAGNFYWFAIGR